MTVKELRQKLFKVENQDAEVILSSDAEGNNYSKVEKIETDFELDGGVILYPNDKQEQNAADLVN